MFDGFLFSNSVAGLECGFGFLKLAVVLPFMFSSPSVVCVSCPWIHSKTLRIIPFGKPELHQHFGKPPVQELESTKAKLEEMHVRVSGCEAVFCPAARTHTQIDGFFCSCTKDPPPGT